MTGSKRVVVVGHGPIGQSFIEKLTEQKADFKISVLCEEPRPAYNRVMLTQYFQDRDGDKNDQMKLSYWSEAQLKEAQVELVYGRAVEIDRAAKEVVYKLNGTATSARLSYDFLVLATGSYCFVPPTPGMTIPAKKNPEWPDDPASRPEGVFVYRTIEDLEMLIAAAGKGAKSAAVIGGGLLGLEAAKAVYDLKLESHVLEMAPYLMPTQLNEAAGSCLTKKIEALDIKVHAGVKINEVLLEGERAVGLKVVEKGAAEATDLKVDLIVVSCGVRPRDELAKACALEMGSRGGVKVDSGLQTSDPAIFAIGEVASIGGNFCYGLWAPGVEQADTLVKNLVDGAKRVEYFKSDLSTKLKLMGVDVASFGRDESFWFKRQFDGKDLSVRSLESFNELDGSYRKLCFSADGTQLIGGLLVGDAKDYSKLLQLSKKDDLGGKTAESLAFGKPAPGEAAGAAADGGDGTGLADDDIVCSCLNVSKADVKKAIVEKDAVTIPLLKKCTKAGTGCGGCCTPVGEVPRVLAATLKAMGKTLATGICPHFAFSRRELFDIIKVKNIKSFPEALETVGKGEGCELCKPIVASILAGLWNDHVLKEGRDQIQDTNDRFLANIQKTGTYSVIPRTAGGDISPQELIAFGECAKKHGLWTKITGAQRLGMFGAAGHQLPAIWKELVEAGFESGHAYGKALRTVKSCVGSTWCRYGQQDSVSMAVALEDRYKGVRAPHKIKMAVSGCLRECAEAQGKDLGLIATSAGYNMYVCGNGGARPKHATLLASDIDEETALKYSDRFLMFYVSTAKHLQRTAPWLEELPGGIAYLKQVVIEDKLGICDELEALMAHNVANYKCEWREVAYDEELQKKFRQFANTEETQKSEQIEYIDMRKQRHPNTYDPPDITGPALFTKENIGLDWEWVFAGHVSDYPKNGGLAVKHGTAEIAVFHLPSHDESTRWLATQNICPHKQARVISRGLVGVKPDGQITLADPIYKTIYDLQTGNGVSHPQLNLSTFPVKESSGKVLVQLPPATELAAAFELQAAEAAAKASFKPPPRGSHPDIKILRYSDGAKPNIDW
eukprot:CAMPEP_0197703570 /NCGR_PEP_ID=MMETSP1338-20131121/125504_1 /TAXON_ID=43686 ORGANISM="Pelagodinium beii, Strain RCC1491" /NCGR_SAMPLE_ID=MMETSP1338 /ASSEMBLY_ACC=CAM_ASM_000754 /LENGTH=1065 /DNA_ID=CAMNT_0043287467 /DNA_START=51 /DNA_END=3248 /DNA_ORIENTATION=+